VKTQWGLGRPFACRTCGTRLVVPKVTASLGIAVFVLFWLLKAQADSAAETALLLAAMVVAGLALTWCLTKPKVVEQSRP
jgi:hypothetical protein